MSNVKWSIMPMRAPHRMTVLLFASLAGCHSLTDVKAPSIIQPADVGNPLGAQARYAGAIVQFTTTWVTSISASALLPDDWLTSNLAGDGPDRKATGRRRP